MKRSGKSRGRRKRAPRVVLAYHLGAPYQERITQGILEYAQSAGPWEIISSPEGASIPLESLAGWDGDGVFATLETESQIEAARSLPFPVVNLANSLRTEGIPTVSGNQRAIGRLAAEHLMDRNFRRFAFYGLEGVWYSAERFAGFRERVERDGYPCSLYETKSSLLAPEPWNLDRGDLGRWLESLEFPAGLLAAHDYRARIVVEECGARGIRIPEDLAVVGVDDDPIVCDFSRPSLTSIRQNGREVGRLAAELLQGWMAGEKRQWRDRFVEPEQVVERESTRTTAVESPVLRRCLEWIDRHHREPIGIDWLVVKVGVSRRRLEGLFRAELDRSPHEVLSAARVESAKRMLREDPERSLKEIASACGFSEARRLSIVFQRVTGMTPREYRA